jgi:hypothetical protein
MTDAKPPKAPVGLGRGGRALWQGIVRDHPGLDQPQRAQLEEACRAKDRLDRLDGLLRGDVDSWATIAYPEGRPTRLVIDSGLQRANETANLMKQLLAALRLPDAQTGKRPAYHGPRGAQKPTVPGGSVSSLDRAREAKSG